MRPEDSQSVLHPPRRAKHVFYGSLAGHVLLFVIPMLVAALTDWLRPELPENLTINLVDEPSTGPKVAQTTTRLPPSPKPQEKVNPPPVPPSPKPPKEPDIPNLTPMPAPPEPELAALPVPKPPKPKLKPPKEPQLANLPKPKPKTAPPPNPDRKMVDTRKVGVKTDNRTDPNIPIGNQSTAQKYGDKFSNTPDGGPRANVRNAQIMGVFLKSRWAEFIPAEPQLGKGNRPEVSVWLEISGDGRLLNARIERPSGNAAMDSAVARLLESLRTQALPKPADGRAWGSRFIFDTSG